jgi:molybdopterin-guanine dinucleotide biosynthesis protein A
MGYLATVLVGHSNRLPNKHLKYVVNGKRLIDLVVENLESLGFDVIIYSKYHFPAPAPIIMDNENWIVPSIISLLKNLNKGTFIFGGDMPLIKKESIEIMEKHLDHKMVVPKWNNGYVEPLHSYYSPQSIQAFEKILKTNNPSLHSAIEICDDVYYIRAEDLDPLTFFNVNTPQDLQTLKKILEDTKTF